MPAKLSVRTLSNILVETHEDQHHVDRAALQRRNLVDAMEKLGVPVTRSVAPLPVDLMWSIDGEPSMWDLKTAHDFIASAEDGRLHKQLKAMEDRGCSLYGFIIEDEVSHDGVTVGYGTHAWTIERFDNLIVSLECEGAKVARSWGGNARTPARIAALYRWSAKVERASWRRPVRPSYSLNRLYGDDRLRNTVEFFMAMFPRVGEEKVMALLDKYTVAELLGSTEEGIASARGKWMAEKGIGRTLADTWESRLRGDFRPTEVKYA